MEFLNKINSLSEIWNYAANNYGENIAICDYYHGKKIDISFNQLHDLIFNAASSFQELNIKKDTKIALFAESSARWIILDQGIIACGAIDVVRGSYTPQAELLYITEHSDTQAIIVDKPELLDNFVNYKNKQNHIKFAIVLWDFEDLDKSKYNFPVYTFDEFIKIGKNIKFSPVNIDKNDLATILYTSGTTGKPKGVMLSHGNLLHQIKTIHKPINCKKGHKFLSILPVWHAYERSSEYYALSQGASVFYTNLKNFKKDILEVNPHSFVGVPRLWQSLYEKTHIELHKKSNYPLILIAFYLSKKYIYANRTLNNSNINNLYPTTFKKTLSKIEKNCLKKFHELSDKLIYSKIRKIFGKNFIRGFSGGGDLPLYLDDFYEIINIEILNGYGLSETSPVLTVRNPEKNIKGTVGGLLAFTNIAIINKKTLRPVKRGMQGIVYARGPQVMKGYYKDPEETAKALYKGRWLNTGDIGFLTKDNQLILTGRAKDLIVLSNGEKIEPEAIETYCCQNPYIKQILLIGQNKKNIGALVVKDNDYIKKHLKTSYFSYFKQTNIDKLIRNDLNKMIKKRPNYRPYECIKSLRLINEEFSMENGLMTQTLKIKRNKVINKYQSIINQIYQNL